MHRAKRPCVTTELLCLLRVNNHACAEIGRTGLALPLAPAPTIIIIIIIIMLIIRRRRRVMLIVVSNNNVNNDNS